MHDKSKRVIRAASIAVLAFNLSSSPVISASSVKPRVGEYSTKARDVVAIGRPANDYASAKTNTVSASLVDRTDANASANGHASICSTLQSAARDNDLPVEFLTRLIWQESRFRADAISPAGAEGVAQFMPATATWIRLENPFDMNDAINKSAELLRRLRSQFGNLGLAAAAYNAGPKRIQDWLTRRRSLPAETKAYVQIVTGHSVIEWTLPITNQLIPTSSQPITCPRLVKDLIDTPERMVLPAQPAATATPLVANPSWAVQLLGNASQVAVLTAYHQMQTRYRTVLQGRQPLVIRSAVGKGGYWYRVRIAADSLPAAQKLCDKLRAIGGNCLVQRN